MSREAMKLALEALEYYQAAGLATTRVVKSITALREALAEPQEKYQYGTPLLDAMTGKANEALDKMAENARELGLDYEPIQCPICKAEDSPYPKCGCVTYVEQPAQHRAWFTVDELNAWADKKLKENPQWEEQPAQRTWVGLTDEEKSDIWCVVTNRDFVTEDTHVYADAIEAKLKEKNNG